MLARLRRPNRPRAWLAALTLVSSSALFAAAADGGDALLPEEVLAGSGQHFPAILASLANLAAEESELLTAKGAFDTVFAAEGYDRAQGFYDGSLAGAKVRQPLRPLGAEIYGQYRLSDGGFPIYEDEFYTGTDGQVKVGAVFSLLRNRALDDRRFEIADATLSIRQVELDVLLVRIGVQQRALQAYWRWVAAGRKLAVYNELLSLAEERETGLKRQVDDGRLAAIFLTENAQYITRRRSLTVTAERDFRLATLDLSFYYRDQNGQTRVPTLAQLPRVTQLQDPATFTIDRQDLERLLAIRPELRQLETAIERAENRLALARNEMQPSLDVTVEYQNGLGEPGPGGPSKNSEDVVLGVTLSVPVARRAARGKVDKAQAEMSALAFEQQQLRDQLALEIQKILLDLTTARDLSALARVEVEQARIMRDAEVRRFSEGASDFFLVNIREETAANALIKWYAAKREARIARANYDAATVNLNGLGLQESATAAP